MVANLASNSLFMIRSLASQTGEGGVRVKKRFLVLLALAGVIAGFVASSSSSAIKDQAGCRIYHSGSVIFDMGCD